MAEIKSITRAHTKQNFPEVNGKVVERVELAAETEYYGITIRFQDKTALTFTVSFEPYVVAEPVFTDWTGGEEKTLKQYQPIRSKVPTA